MDRIDWKLWNKVPLRSKYLLPEYSGIYIVTDQIDFVLYVGKSKNIKARWIGHHRHKQLIRRDKKDRKFFIYFNHFPIERLDEEERYYINLLCPSLNSTKITKRIPKVPTAESVLTKLLRAINRKTGLFPDVRSLVLGCWQTNEPDDSYCHIAIAVGLNDIDSVVANSACIKSRNRWIRGSLKKNTNWRYYETHCGLPEDQYHPVEILTYLYQDYAIHFVWIGWEILEWAIANKDKLSNVNLFGVETYCLKNSHILETVKLERYDTVVDAKKKLYDSDFILSVIPSMQPTVLYAFEI